tara:strand:- start:168 stop:623 length:456 start_codon:yes stop_codon:yes gene_type:complete
MRKLVYTETYIGCVMGLSSRTLEDDNLPHLVEGSWAHLVHRPSLVSSTEARGANGLMEYLHKDCKHWEYFSAPSHSNGQNVLENRQVLGVKIASWQRHSLSFFKLHYKPGSAMNYSSKKAGEVKMQRKEKTNELLVNGVLEEPLIFELGGQ